jgi:hypothetical protein
MVKYLNYLDVFGTTFHFTTMNDSKFRTPIGALLSILCFIVITVFCFIFGRDFLFKKNPRVLTQIVVPDKYRDPFRMTADNFVIPWRLTDLKNLPIDFENKFYPIITYQKFETNSSGQYLIYKRQIDIVKCNETFAKVPEFTENFPVNNYYCMDWSQDNYTLGGNWDGHYLNTFDITIYFCKDGQNFSPESNCTDINIVKDSFNQFIYFDILYPEYYFVPEDLDNPLRISYKTYYYLLSLNIQKIDRLFFKEVFLYDDQGWIVTEHEESKILGAADLKSDFNYFDSSQYGVDGNPSIFYSIEFYTQKNYDKIYRSYMKFQDFAAVIGGFMKIVLVAGGLFSFLFNDIIRDEIIYNMLFEYQPINDENNVNVQRYSRINTDIQLKNFKKERVESKLSLSNNIKKSHLNNLKDTSNSNSISNNIFLSTNLNLKDVSNLEKINPSTIINHENLVPKNNNDSNLNKINDLNKMYKLERKSIINTTKQSNYKLNTEIKNKSLNFGIWFSIKVNYCPSKFFKNNPEKEKVFVFLNNYLKERLDVVHYLKKLEIIDRMRTLFFNYYQNLSFEFLKTPNLCNESEMKNFDLKIDKNAEENFNDLVDYFSYRFNNKELDQVDENLLNYINPEIKKLALSQKI